MVNIFIFICTGRYLLTRIYLGFYYLTDILAGALIGIFLMWLFSVLEPFGRLAKKTVTLSNRFPGIFYACFFILCYQIATLFSDSRALIDVILNYLFS